MVETIKITWEMMAGLINREFLFIHYGKWNGKQIIQEIQIWDGCSAIDESYMYLTLQHPLSKISSRKMQNIVTLLEGDTKSHREQSQGYFVFCQEKSKMTVLNRILHLYNQCREWQHQLRHAARQERNMQAIVTLCANYLGMSTAIVNSAYEIGIYQDKENAGFCWSDFQNADGKMSEESIEDLYLNGTRFEETFEKKGLTLFEQTSFASQTKHYSYYYNFMDNEDRYLGRILFAPAEGCVEKGIEELMNFAAKEAENCFLATMRGAAPTKLSRRLHQLLESLLENQKVSRLETEATLEADGWGMTDGYFILKLVSYANIQSSHTLAYYCHLLESDYDNVCAIEKNTAIFCLVNKKDEETTQIFRKNLSYFLRDNLFLAGMSCSFESFLDCSIYAKEAAYALTIGQQSGNVRWLHRFEEVTLTYCLKKICEEYPAGDLIHPGLHILEHYDSDHPGSDLTMTLREYLRNLFNATHAAEILHVHRTTLLYRLRRIEELTGMQLNDEKTMLHLLLSYALTEAGEKEDCRVKNAICVES